MDIDDPELVDVVSVRYLYEIAIATVRMSKEVIWKEKKRGMGCMGGIYPLEATRLEINRQVEKGEEDSPLMY